MKKIVISLLVAAACFGFSSTASAQIKLANIFGDNMVLQRNQPLYFWGTAPASERVSISIRGVEKSTVTMGDGTWMLTMDPIVIGAPFDVAIRGEKNGDTTTLKNVLAGEVWICSGQSNMEWPVSNAGNPKEEAAAANYPLIRHVKVRNTVSPTVLDDVPNSGWQVCTPETAGNFTAVGYYFGRHLHQELGGKVPIGLINTTWGGTIVEAWTSAESLRTHPDFTARIAEIQKLAADKEGFKERQAEALRWQQEFDKAIDAPTGNWQSADTDDTNWESVKAPAHWESFGYPNLDGVAWYRKTVDIPAAMAGQNATLSLAMVDDFDLTYVNGTKVGSEDQWNTERVYPVGADAMKAGPMTVTIRVTDTGAGGGMHGAGEAMFLEAGGQKVSLAGDWKFKVDAATAALAERPKTKVFSGPNNPTALYNGMVDPIIPISFKGAIWYQGESNAGRAFQYQTLFPLLINDWRAKWVAGRNRYAQQTPPKTDADDFPFYWVQLANFTEPSTEPAGSQWAELREAQSMTLKLPNSGEAVIIDIGEAGDIHPKNKQDVGKRLAVWALAKNYNVPVVFSGPRYKSVETLGNKMTVSFDHIGGGLAAKGGDLKRFEICGADEKFVWADAVISGDNVVVSSGEIQSPVAVRYAWANNPEGCNLYNKEGLPASPFRTDKFKGVTEY